MPIPIRLDALKDGARSGEAELDDAFAADRLGADFGVAQTIVVRWRAQMIHNVVEVRAKLVGALSFGCSRCGDPLTLPVSHELSHHWVAKGSLAEGDDDESVDDPDLSEHDGHEIDLEPVALDAIVVEVPLAPDCTDAVEQRCERWSDEPVVYVAGEPPPESDTHKPFAALLSKLHPSDDKPEA
jgi:uncharacterized metal-binding protein YceD (DUF177 family)